MEIDRNLLIRFFSEEASDNEKIAIREWLGSDEKNKRFFINERIRFDASLITDDNNIVIASSKGIRHIIWNTLKIASLILILVGSGFFLSRMTVDLPEITEQTISVPAGNRSSLILPDGTLVWLNSGSILKYPTIFSDKKRVVELDGEAYFDVIKDEKKSFIIKTSKYNVEVLGTTLNVDAYSEKATFSTALFTGKVKLYKEYEEGNELFLKQGETAELIDDKLQVYSRETEIYRWRDGILVIENKSFEEIMSLFEKYYGQTIIIENNKLKELGYHGKLRISDGVDHALRALQNDFRFTYKRDEDINRIYIY